MCRMWVGDLKFPQLEVGKEVIQSKKPGAVPAAIGIVLHSEQTSAPWQVVQRCWAPSCVNIVAGLVWSCSGTQMKYEIYRHIEAHTSSCCLPGIVYYYDLLCIYHYLSMLSSESRESQSWGWSCDIVSEDKEGTFYHKHCRRENVHWRQELQPSSGRCHAQNTGYT